MCNWVKPRPRARCVRCLMSLHIFFFFLSFLLQRDWPRFEAKLREEIIFDRACCAGHTEEPDDELIAPHLVPANRDFFFRLTVQRSDWKWIFCHRWSLSLKPSTWDDEKGERNALSKSRREMCAQLRLRKQSRKFHCRNSQTSFLSLFRRLSIALSTEHKSGREAKSAFWLANSPHRSLSSCDTELLYRRLRSLLHKTQQHISFSFTKFFSFFRAIKALELHANALSGFRSKFFIDKSNAEKWERKECRTHRKVISARSRPIRRYHKWPTLGGLIIKNL